MKLQSIRKHLHPSCSSVFFFLLFVEVDFIGSTGVCRRARWCNFFAGMAETRVLGLCSPGIELAFCFRIGFAVFSSKKCNSRRAALYKNMLSSPFRIVFFGVCLCVCVRVAFRIGICFLPTLDFLHMTALTCICLSALCGVGGGMGGDDVHVNAACVFCFFCCVTSQTLPVAQ